MYRSYFFDFIDDIVSNADQFNRFYIFLGLYI